MPSAHGKHRRTIEWLTDGNDAHGFVVSRFRPAGPNRRERPRTVGDRSFCGLSSAGMHPAKTEPRCQPCRRANDMSW